MYESLLKNYAGILSLLVSVIVATIYFNIRKHELRKERAEIIKRKIPQSLVAWIIGRKGNNIKGICNRSGAHVNIGDSSTNSDTVEVTITGNRRNVNVAEILINESIEKKRDKVCEDVFVDKKILIDVIGKNGNNITKISKHFNIRIKIHEHDTDKSRMKISLNGARTDIRKAKEIICNIRNRIQAEKSKSSKQKQNERFPMKISNKSIEFEMPKIRFTSSSLTKFKHYSRTIPSFIRSNQLDPEAESASTFESDILYCL